MKQYLNLVKHVLSEGTRKSNRTGVDTISTFGYFYEIDLNDGFPLLTTKEVSWKNIVIELLWFLSGSDKSDFLERHKCYFWRPWYNIDGTVKNCYGPAWRNFNGNDQIKWILNELKNNPMSRRMIVSAWNPDVAQSAPLPPCHSMFILNVQNDNNGENKLCLHLTQRSADVMLGIPYNIASYSLLLSIFSHLTGIKPGIFAHSLIDAHIYTCKENGDMKEYDHIPGAQEQINRIPLELSKLIIDKSIKNINDIENLIYSNSSTEEILSLIKLENYNHHPQIKFKVAV